VTGTGSPRWRRLADQLAQEIRSGQRVPGSKLPSFAEQDAAGCSQTTTMRAYRELTAAGLAVTVQGSGTYVADPLPATHPSPTLEELATRIAALEEWRRTLETQGGVAPGHSPDQAGPPST
jgi:DNA-binding GntR family transcriptional regulator